MKLLISIHDVTPALMPQVESLYALCRSRGVTPALLVVPDWHGAWPLTQHPEFVSWARAREAEGAEILLHGERHDEAGAPRGMVDALRAFGRTNGEGEFLTLDLAQASERIERGVGLLRAYRLNPVGFVPPAWLMKPDTILACQRAGLGITEDDGSLYLLGAKVTTIASPVVRWSGRAPMRAWASVLVAGARWRLQRDAEFVRIAYHPSDLDHPATANSASRELDRWLDAGPVVRYDSLRSTTAAAP